jgi:dTDP-4-dehydrorhamnose reductase
MGGMRWLITGAGGMLAADLRAALAGRDVVALTRAELDITDAEATYDATAGVDVIVNTAAWTRVDDAEAHEPKAFAVNAIGAANLARGTARHGARLVQLSTDYVFDGAASTPYAEDAPVAPRSAYGRTKLAGEWAVRALLPDRSWVVRTAWLYGAHGPSFVRTMARLAAERETVDVVADQCGQPTWTADLAAQIVALVDADAPSGIYHATSSGATTWHGLAAAVFELLGHDPARVRPTTSDAFVRPAPRPAWSVLSHDGWTRTGVAPIGDWRERLTAAWPTLGLG